MKTNEDILIELFDLLLTGTEWVAWVKVDCKLM